MTTPISPEDLDTIDKLVARVEELEGALRTAKEEISRWPVHLGETITAIDRVLGGTE